MKKLVFDRPANTFRESVPLGNGRIGAMLFGGICDERIVLNESSLWSGSPENADKADAHLVLPEVRRLLLQGENDRAEALVMEHFVCNGPGSGHGKGAHVPYGCYQVLGNLRLTFHGNDPSEMPDTGAMPKGAPHYRRVLDLEDATMRMEYRVNGIVYRREAFCSAPAQALVARYSCELPGRVSFRVRIDRPECYAVEPDGDGGLLLYGSLDDGKGGLGVSYACRLRIVTAGGSVRLHGEGLEVQGADAVTLFVTARTDAATFATGSSRNPRAATLADMGAIASRPWPDLLAEHRGDYGRYYNRVRLELGSTVEDDRPTIQRLASFAKGDADPGLAALLFNYGRYLLISSSRPGGLPANLQGIWAEEIQTPWNGDWHLNAQQMNYWPAESCNLGDLHTPYLKLVASLQEAGSCTARAYYAAAGWVAHVITNPWGFTSPGEHASWGATTTGSAWLCLHLWEHWLYTLDHDYLAWAYPILRGSALFYLDMLVEEPGGHLVTAPANSPENAFVMEKGQVVSVCMGPAYDMQILRFLFAAVADAAETLSVDDELVTRLRTARSRLAPTRIGSDGRILEWLEEYPEALPYHRHTSHLWALFPGDEISPDRTPDTARAAAVTLLRRGTATPGWALAHRQCFWARLEEGDRAHDHLTSILRWSSFPNLMGRCYHGDETADADVLPDLEDADHPFQIDANLGATAGIAEMLFQSHGGVLRILPALPTAWPDGSVQGLRGRGAFEVDIAWAAGRLVTATVRSCGGRDPAVRYGPRSRVISLAPGEEVRLNGALEVV